MPWCKIDTCIYYTYGGYGRILPVENRLRVEPETKFQGRYTSTTPVRKVDILYFIIKPGEGEVYKYMH